MKYTKKVGLTPQKQGRRFERAWASALGVEPVKGSGNLWYAKLDVRDQSVLFSCKHTDAESFRLSSDLMREVQEAINGNGGIGGETIPAIATSVNGEVFVTLTAQDFLRMFTEDSKWIPASKGEAKRKRASVPALLRDEDHT